MDAFLPPATPQQIAAVYAHLHVTHHAVLLTRWEEFFALVPLTLHLALPWLMLATGLSAALRERAALGAARLLRLALVSRVMQHLNRREKQQGRYRGTWLAPLVQWDKRVGQWTKGLKIWREWDPQFFRTTLLYGLAYALIYRFVRLPFNYSAYRLESSYGLTHMSAASWFSARGTEWLAGFAVNTIGAVLLLGVIRFSPRRWPYLLALLFACLSLAVLRLPPDSSADVKPLPANSSLSQRLHALTLQAGIPKARIVIDESNEGKNDSNGGSRYAGSTPYISLTRKLVDTKPAAQVEATLAHEIGHCVHQDDVRTLLPTALGVFLAFPFIRWLAERMLTRFAPRWRVLSLADPAALPLLLLCFHLVTLVTDPLANAYSRTLERHADAYGLSLTRNRLALAEEYVGFCNQDGDEPSPPAWFVCWHYGHPTDAERIRFALTGQPERITYAR